MINFKHLRYFWVVAKSGSIASASESLHLTPQTISGQLSMLESYLGEKLFDRVGRGLELTDTGRMVLSYADEIFSLGSELEQQLHNLPEGRSLVFKVGITDVVPKSIAYRLISPSMQLDIPVRIVCREGDLTSLLADLAVHRVDLVISDETIPAGVNVLGYNHPLGECGTSFLAAPQIIEQLEGEFPDNLMGAPFLLPGENTLVRNRLLQWLDKLHIHPHIVGEFDDSALMKAFGQAGTGIFIAPTPIADEVVSQYDVQIIGQTELVREEFYAISVERKISHPAVTAITEMAREWLFKDSP